MVYVDDADSPSQIYVEHSFGFAQLFGDSHELFEKNLSYYLLVNMCFHADKIRLYAPSPPKWLNLSQDESWRSYRQRFAIDTNHFTREQSPSLHQEKIKVEQVNEMNIGLISEAFGVVRHFWRNAEDFIVRSNAVVIFYEGKPASICYSAAQASNRVEIDVLTLPEYRNLGLGKQAVNHFVLRCFDLSLIPLWDCFTNNSGSMMLCKSIGFYPITDPYPFFTINKKL
ncbi:hypothetical protein TUM19329_13360 [Legionella antarctica]|uniref:N-acetyltransferase domain-containing protein n=1 Tax=Legionella antarctica TaxID=2708020 RepID=A0A6F8T2S9_9GAMM|nr:hypothetical protein TUM19329_13360 [Legionella antarctica]